MNNTMTISDGIKKSIVKDYENKLFKMYERILNDKEKLFKDKGFQLVMFKQKFDTKLNKWINDTDENFDKVEFNDGYKCVVTFALYKNGQNYIVNNKKVMNTYYVTDITRRTSLDNKWVIKYFVLNPDTLKDIEYFYVVTSTM